MSDLARFNPTGRFTGLAELYTRCRPSYPAAAIDWIVRRCLLAPGSLVIDVGCGTGISSRLFAERGLQVIGIEPNADMRTFAETESLPSGKPAPIYCHGRAEQTGLPAGTADAVLAAQAFHWFEHETALAEFHRILKPGGWVVLMWNEHDDADRFTAAYSAVTGSTPQAAAVELGRGRAGEPLLVSTLFCDGEKVVFPNEQILGEEELVGRALSASYAPRGEAVPVFTAAMRQIFAEHQREGKVTLRYETLVYVARR